MNKKYITLSITFVLIAINHLFPSRFINFDSRETSRAFCLSSHFDKTEIRWNKGQMFSRRPSSWKSCQLDSQRTFNYSALILSLGLATFFYQTSRVTSKTKEESVEASEDFKT